MGIARLIVISTKGVHIRVQFLNELFLVGWQNAYGGRLGPQLVLKIKSLETHPSSLKTYPN